MAADGRAHEKRAGVVEPYHDEYHEDDDGACVVGFEEVEEAEGHADVDVAQQRAAHGHEGRGAAVVEGGDGAQEEIGDCYD